MQRARHDGRYDDRVDNVPSITLQLQQLQQPDRIFIRRFARIGCNAPTLPNLHTVNQREFNIGVSSFNREQHNGSLNQKYIGGMNGTNSAIRQAEV